MWNVGSPHQPGRRQHERRQPGHRQLEEQLAQGLVAVVAAHADQQVRRAVPGVVNTAHATTRDDLTVANDTASDPTASDASNVDRVHGQ